MDLGYVHGYGCYKSFSLFSPSGHLLLIVATETAHACCMYPDIYLIISDESKLIQLPLECYPLHWAHAKVTSPFDSIFIEALDDNRTRKTLYRTVNRFFIIWLSLLDYVRS